MRTGVQRSQSGRVPRQWTSAAAPASGQISRAQARRDGRPFAASTGTSPDRDLQASHAAPSRRRHRATPTTPVCSEFSMTNKARLRSPRIRAGRYVSVAPPSRERSRNAVKLVSIRTNAGSIPRKSSVSALSRIVESVVKKTTGKPVERLSPCGTTAGESRSNGHGRARGSPCVLSTARSPRNGNPWIQSRPEGIPEG